MQKRDASPAGAAARRRVDEAVSRRATASERAVEIGDSVADVMDPRPAPGEESRDGAVRVELLEPLQADGPVAKFLARRGPGIHHICYRVPDLDQALARCRAAGYQLVDERPRRGAGGRRIAFLHPKATAGILLELTE